MFLEKLMTVLQDAICICKAITFIYNMPPHTSAPSEHTKVMRSCEGGPPGRQGLPPMYLNSRPTLKSEMMLKPLSTSPSERGSALSLYQQAAVPKGHLLRLSSVVRLTGPQREMTRLE